MKLILRYLKPFVALVALCLLLLFGQAMCELSLPNLMSNIVNVGIQQGGIDDQAPDVISKDGMTLLSYFLNDTDRATFQQAYTFVGAGTPAAEEYTNAYPQVVSTDFYALKTLGEDEKASVQRLYGRASYAFMLYMQNFYASMPQTDGSGEGQGAGGNEGFANVDMRTLYPQLLPAFASMPAESFNEVMEQAAQADNMMSGQVGVTFKRLFYKELGADLDTIQSRYIWKTGLMMLVITLLGALATVIVGYLAARISSAVARRMRHDVFEKVSHFSSAEFDQFSTASLITRTTNDIQQVQMLLVMGIRMVCYAPIMGIGGVVMAVGKSLSLSWIIAAAVVVLLGLILVIFSIAVPKFKILQKLIDKLNLVSRENLSGLMVIRAFGNETHEEKRFDAANRELSNTNRFVQRTMAFMMPAMMLIMNVVTLIIIWVGAHEIASSALQVGDMMAFIQYAMQIIMAFLMIAMMFIMVPRASVSAVRISEVLACEPSIRDKETVKSLGKVTGDIAFHNVSFRYTKAEDDVLHHISFTAKAGQTTAFIGSTGSGKSTLINLIPRFYDVTEGSITIDGIDIRDISQKELRDNIGYIPQKGVLFSGDIASNIRYGKEDATPEELMAAIEVAQAREFVDGTKEGVSTPIAQGGTNVSGGQKQRLSIARALAKQPPIYIFDDSFSALDFKTDAALRSALSKTIGHATILIVAQRISTIMDADQIIVLDEGKMVGIGRHKELLSTCAAYREIAESQLSKEELA